MRVAAGVSSSLWAAGVCLLVCGVGSPRVAYGSRTSARPPPAHAPPRSLGPCSRRSCGAPHRRYAVRTARPMLVRVRTAYVRWRTLAALPCAYGAYSTQEAGTRSPYVPRVRRPRDVRVSLASLQPDRHAALSAPLAQRPSAYTRVKAMPRISVLRCDDACVLRWESTTSGGGEGAEDGLPSARAGTRARCRISTSLVAPRVPSR